MRPDFIPVIGLEVHCQLATESKIFCSCRARLERGFSVGNETPNIHTCPVCAGHPGTLPVLNKKAVEYAIRTGLATQCTINPLSVFARKNYFYPDLPKGYQISQYDQPLCENGQIEIDLHPTDETKAIRIQRIHVEEDAGKNVHMFGYSLINLNRAGVPLIEIVSAPDLSSPEQAGTYLRSLYAIVTALGVCDGNLQEGNFRCDANVSVMPKGSTQLGTRTEIKNVNSFRFVEKAIEYEINRQVDVLLGGGVILQETRLYDSDQNKTFSMRSKEEAHDYRYFPEPDLLPLKIDATWIEQIRANLPELPERKKSRLMRDYGLSRAEAAQITQSQEQGEQFETAMALISQKLPASHQAAKTLAHLLIGEVARLSHESSGVAGKLEPSHLAELVALLLDQKLSNTGAKQVLNQAWKTGKPIAQIVQEENLSQVSDTEALDPILDQILLQFPNQAQEFRNGKDKLVGFFVGQAMKATNGKANPGILQELLLKKLKKP